MLKGIITIALALLSNLVLASRYKKKWHSTRNFYFIFYWAHI